MNTAGPMRAASAVRPMMRSRTGSGRSAKCFAALAAHSSKGIAAVMRSTRAGFRASPSVILTSVRRLSRIFI